MLDTFIKLYEMVTACNGPLQMLSDAEEAGEDSAQHDSADRDKESVKESLFMRGLAYWYWQECMLHLITPTAIMMVAFHPPKRVHHLIGTAEKPVLKRERGI